VWDSLAFQRPATSHTQTLVAIFKDDMTDKEIKTRVKVLPTILRLFLGLVSISMLVVAISFSGQIFSEPTIFNLVSVLIFSFMGFFFLGLGPISITTYSTDGKFLIENTLGLFQRRTDFKDIERYKLKQSSNGFGAFDELIINKRDGHTIFIQSFDQADFKEFRLEISKLIKYDNETKPNYWTKFYKASTIFLTIWVLTMVIAMLIGA